jgi:hypothetical protein
VKKPFFVVVVVVVAAASASALFKLMQQKVNTTPSLTQVGLLLALAYYLIVSKQSQRVPLQVV